MIGMKLFLFLLAIVLLVGGAMLAHNKGYLEAYIRKSQSAIEDIRRRIAGDEP